MPWSRAADLNEFYSKYSGPTTRILAGRSGAVYYIHTTHLALSNSSLLSAQFVGSRPGSVQEAIDWRGFEEVIVERVLEYLSTRDYPVLQGDGQYCYIGTVGREQVVWEERTGIRGYSWMNSNHAYGTYQAMCDAVLKGGNAGETTLECVALSRVLVSFQVLIDLKQPMFPYLAHVVHLIYSAPLNYFNDFGKGVISNLVGKNLMEISGKDLDSLLCGGGEFTMDVTNVVSRRAHEQTQKIEKEVVLKTVLLDKLEQLKGVGLKTQV